MQTRSFWKNGVMGFFDETGNTDYKLGVWANCPLLAIANDPALGYIVDEDFSSFYAITAGNPDTLSGWTCTQEANNKGVISISDAANGILLIDSESTTQHDKCEMQQNIAHFKVTALKDIWFEAKVALDDYNKNETFVGLATLHTTVMPSGAMDNTDVDHIGFMAETAKVGVNYFTLCADDTEISDTMGTTGTFEENTYIRLGFHVDGTTGIHAFINGEEQTLTNVIATGLPTTDALAITLICGSDGGSKSPAMSVDWVRCVQLR